MPEHQIEEIIKRNGTSVKFNPEKIKQAIWKAALKTKEFNYEIADFLSEEVEKEMQRKRKKKFQVEEIQDIVEKVLIMNDWPKTAKEYILYRDQRRQKRMERQQVLEGKDTKLNLSINALKVLSGRYLVRDEHGKIVETPEDMFHRVAHTLAGIEKNYGMDIKDRNHLAKRFYEIMTNLEFLPAGRTLANTGAQTRLVSNCIVLHIEDSMQGIFETLKNAALLQQAGSGLGFPFHMLRPSGVRAKTSAGVASGPVSFLRVYNEAFGVIKQQGRHGANMAVMRVDHPDILDFIHCKAKEGDIKNFNISVGLTDRFMEEVRSKSKKPWMCEFNGKQMLPRRIKRDQFGIVSEIEDASLTAEELFDEIVTAAWNNGEPGIVFPDAVNKTNPLPELGRIEACNPCGEQFLHDGDVCNLGSLNLEKFVVNKQIDWNRLKDVVRLATRMLDNVIDLTDFPVEKVNSTFRSNRRIGLGLMGFADMLFQLDIPYNSPKGFKTAEEVMKFITDTSHEMSQELAKQKGVFPNWKKSIYAKKNIKMRNVAMTTVAPTGSISMLAEVSSGIEPHFALAFKKSNIMGGQELYYVNRYFMKVLEEKNLDTPEILEEISQTGTIQNLKKLPKEIKDIFVTSMDISAEDHIKMQAAFQKFVDNSISKTINFPSSATKHDVFKGYMHAWELGLKGCTVYRDGSRDVQILNLNKKPKPTTCPKCGGDKFVDSEGCKNCLDCGYSYCSI